MKKVKSFLYIFKRSFFPTHSYYQKILRIPFNFSFKYFIFLIVLLNCVILFWLGLRFSPQKLYNLLKSVNVSLEKYPNDLKIIIHNGLAVSNYNRPYFLWLDYKNKKQLIAVIDENANPEKIYLYKSLMLLTSKEIILNFNKLRINQSPYIYPLSSLPNQTITKQEVSQISNLLKKIIKNFILVYFLIAVMAAIIILISSFLINLLYLTLATSIVFLIYKSVFKKRVHFKKTLQIGCHAVTFPLVLDYFLIIFPPSISRIIYFPLPKFFFQLSFFTLISIFIFAGLQLAHSSKNDKI